MHILIADDDSSSLKLLEATLVGLGHTVSVARGGDEASKQYFREPASVVITDWMMPTMSGLELIQAIRKSDRMPYTYCFVLTSLSGKQKLLDALDAGADDFITKPFDDEELEAKLKVADRIISLQERVQNLEKLLPICMYCKKIRQTDQSWEEVEAHIQKRTETRFSHGMCPGCIESVVKPQVKEQLGISDAEADAMFENKGDVPSNNAQCGQE